MSYTKLEYANNVIKISEFQFKPLSMEQPTYYRKVKAKRGESHFYLENKRLYNYRVKSYVEFLGLANFKAGDKFITLTFDPKKGIDPQNLDACNAKKNMFIRRLRKSWPLARYFGVIEFQQNGNIHYHMVTNIQYFNIKHLQRIWPYGHCKIQKVVGLSHVLYLVKYTVKSLEDKRLFLRRRFFSSNNLFRPQTLSDGVDKQLALDRLSLYKPMQDYVVDKPTSWVGRIHRRLYLLKDRIVTDSTQKDFIPVGAVLKKNFKSTQLPLGVNGGSNVFE